MNGLIETRCAALGKSLDALRGDRERLAWLVSEAQRRPALPEACRIPAHQIEGCLARLWVVCEYHDDRCHYRCDSDSLVVKAVASVLCELHTDAPAAEILSFDPSLLAPLGVTQHLTPNRRNALSRVVERIRAFASERADR